MYPNEPHGETSTGEEDQMLVRSAELTVCRYGSTEKALLAALKYVVSAVAPTS